MLWRAQPSSVILEYPQAGHHHLPKASSPSLYIVNIRYLCICCYHLQEMWEVGRGSLSSVPSRLMIYSLDSLPRDTFASPYFFKRRNLLCQIQRIKRQQPTSQQIFINRNKENRKKKINETYFTPEGPARTKAGGGPFAFCACIRNFCELHFDFDYNLIILINYI